MKKLVQINTVCNGSTGKIMCDIAKEAKKKNYQVYCFFGRGKANNNFTCIKMESNFSIYLHLLIARLGFNGHGSYFATKRLIRHLKNINPNVIHLHNVHGYYINLKVLFKYLKNDYRGKIVWTLHDCWAFTGHCSFFTMANCNNWKIECNKCRQLNRYPKEFFDTSRKEYCLKKKIFTDLNNLILVTPSTWLKTLVRKSFLSEYDVTVINNGINLEVFKQSMDKTIYDKYNIPCDKKIILGVANIWEARKGLSDFLELNKLIDKERYAIVLVGVDARTKESISKDIICISRTDNQIDLAKLYSLATVFFNPTYEDNYPTVNLESLACKTPVISYDTGGCKEQIDNYGGYIVNKKDFDTILKIIDNIKEIKNTNLNEMSLSNMVSNYIQIYKE